MAAAGLASRVAISACALALAGVHAGHATTRLTGGSTELRLNAHLLDDLGMSIASSWADGSDGEFEEWDLPILETSELELLLPGGSYRGLGSGHLVHSRGPKLLWPGGAIDLSGCELHPGLPPEVFELRAADGSLAFVLDNVHPMASADGKGFLFLDMDLRLSLQLAERLGKPELAGLAVGEAHVRARLGPGSMLAPYEPKTRAHCVADFTGEVDVQLHSMPLVSEIHHDATRVALAPSVGLINVGAADVEWFRPIAPDGTPPFTVVGQHPFLSMNVYRLLDDRLEHIGQSDLKHAFFSGNTPPCDCEPAQVLFNDCTDVYGAGTNANRLILGPRDELTASTGAWSSAGSHFDGTPVDDFRSHNGSDAHHPDKFEHRLTVSASDLEAPGAEYFVEAWYLVKDDVDIFNSMGHRSVAPAFTTGWSFPFTDAGLTLGSILDVWVDPANPPPNASTTVIETNPHEGRLQLAVKGTRLPNAFYRYEYALANFDFDRRIDSVSVPLPAGSSVTATGFGDLDDDDGNDWPATVGPTEIRWDAPAGNDLDWGTLFNFSFEANAAPEPATVTLGVLEPGNPGELTATAHAPVVPIPLYLLTVALSGPGSGGVVSTPAGIVCGGDCSETVAEGLEIELAATASPGSALAGWQEGGAPAGLSRRLPLTVTGDRSLTAVFETCEADVSLSPQTVSAPTVFHACETLDAGSGFRVEDDAVFRAGIAIRVDSGFAVAPGGTWGAELAPEQAGGS